MTLSEFILSGEAEMKHAVVHQGVLIAKRKSSDCLVLLFQMDGFYVETFCDVHQKAVCEYRAFKNLNTLKPYLESIRLDELLK